MAVPLPPPGADTLFQATHVTSLGRLCRKQVAFEIEFWIFRTYLSILGNPGSMKFLWLIGAHFHWPAALSPVLENFCRSFSRPNWPPLGLRGWYLSGFFKTLPPNRPLFFFKKKSINQSFILTRYVKELEYSFKIRTCINKIYNNYSYII